MARIIFPTTFEGWSKLFYTIKQKHDDDAGSSILIPYFTEESIDISADKTSVDDANGFNKEFNKNAKDAEELYRDCINKLDKIANEHRLMVQNLKQFYRKNISKLGAWGVTVNGNRIVYPTDRDELSAAIKTFIEKHNTFAPGTSPISDSFLTENGIDLTTNLTDCDDVVTINIDWAAARKTAEEKSADRDVKMVRPKDDVRGSANFIVKQFPKNPKRAGQYGLVIDDSTQAAKLTTTKLNEGKEKVIYQVVSNSIVQNTGVAVITITKGETGTGTAITLNPGDHWQVAKGYSVMTISNPSLTLKGALQYMKS